MERENTSLKRKVEELEEKLHEKEAECGRLSKKMKTVEKDNDSLQRATFKYELQNRDLEREASAFFSLRTLCGAISAPDVGRVLGKEGSVDFNLSVVGNFEFCQFSDWR